MMSTVGSQPANRFSDPEFQNWLKVARSLLVLRDGLGEFTKQEIDSFHQILKQNPPPCGKCIEGKKNAPKKPKAQPCTDCQPWIEGITKVHCNKGGIYWNNSSTANWATNAWELAKLYMGKGQTPGNKGPHKTDCAGLLTLISQCKLFKSKLNTSLKPIQNVSYASIWT